MTRLNLARNRLERLLPPADHELAIEVDVAAGANAAPPPPPNNLSCAHFRGVTDMNLSGNALVALPADMGRCAALTSLRLEGNRLASLPASLLRGGASHLRRLSLRGNRFAELPYALGELRWERVCTCMLHH
jgi:Leucine-rich repeat (LRR) protein